MQQQSSSRTRDPGGGGRGRPRVVILDAGDWARVAVLELPDSLEIGDRFCHSDTWWRVTNQRPGSRVFIAQPIPPPDQDLGSTI
jgi:hypothetical protein